MTRSFSRPLQLIPEYRDYVWGGNRLRPGQLTAEAWVIYEEDRIAGEASASDPFVGRTLAELAAEDGPALLGEQAGQRTDARFPLLVKILDCAQWLSLQVHPNDEQAVRLEGSGQFGKTEAWHVLEAVPNARLIAGMRPETTAATLAEAIRGGTILDWVQYRDARAGDTVFMPAGTIHALGPGLLIYEVQQTSDLTYRVFDWNRPQTAERVLHIDKSLAVADPSASAPIHHTPILESDGRAMLVRCPYFTLEMVAGQARPVDLDTTGRTFHALTVIEGMAQIDTSEVSMTLKRFESVVIPAACGAYRLRPLGSFRVLKSSLP